MQEFREKYGKTVQVRGESKTLITFIVHKGRKIAEVINKRVESKQEKSLAHEVYPLIKHALTSDEAIAFWKKEAPAKESYAFYKPEVSPAIDNLMGTLRVWGRNKDTAYDIVGKLAFTARDFFLNNARHTSEPKLVVEFYRLILRLPQVTNIDDLKAELSALGLPVLPNKELKR